MIGCLVHIIIVAIVLLIVLIIVERLLAAFGWADQRIIMLVRLLFGLIILLTALSCLGILDGGDAFPMRHVR